MNQPLLAGDQKASFFYPFWLFFNKIYNTPLNPDCKNENLMCFLSLESLDLFSYKEIKQGSVNFLQLLMSSSSKFRNRDTIISIELPVILWPLRIRTLKLSWKDLALIGCSRTEEYPVEQEGAQLTTTSKYTHK